MSIVATIEDWLLDMPEPYRSKALANMMEDAADLPVESLTEALLDAFRFESTPEGSDYWWMIIDQFEDGDEE